MKTMSIDAVITCVFKTQNVVNVVRHLVRSSGIPSAMFRISGFPR